MKRELYKVDKSHYIHVDKYTGIDVRLVVKRCFPPVVTLKESIKWNIVTLGKVKIYCLYDAYQLVHKSFVVRGRTKFPFLQDNDIEIGPCFTSEEYRGRGYYPFVLSKIIAFELKGEGVAYMIVNDENIPSLRGISKVGFKKTGYIVTTDFLKRYIPIKDEKTPGDVKNKAYLSDTFC